MTPAERETFATAMARLFDIYGDELTANVLDAWAGVLGQYPLREVRWAMNAHVTDPDKGRFRPTPADIIRHVTETLPAFQAARRRERVAAMRDRLRPMEDKLLLLRKEVELGIKTTEAVQPEIDGLLMQIGALQREVGIDDRPRLNRPGGTAPEQLAIPKELDRDADPHDPA